MPIKIEMPKLSDTMIEGTLLRWHKNVGETVEIGDILAEIETDKATMEMEAFDEGILAEIVIQAGQKAPIGSVLAVLTMEGETLDYQSKTEKKAPSKKATAVSEPGTTSSAPTPNQSTHVSASVQVKASPLAKKIASAKGVDLQQVKGTGPGGRIVAEDVEAAAKNPPAKEKRPMPDPVADSTPESAIAKMFAAAAATVPVEIPEMDVHVDKASRISLPKPEEISANQKAPQVSQLMPAASAPISDPAQPARSQAMPSEAAIPLTTMRQIIAERLLISKTTIPHFYLRVEINAVPLMALRAQINYQAERTHGHKYTINDFIMRAVILACQIVPSVNAKFAGDSIIRFNNVGLSVAVAVEDGLVTPVIKNAQSKSLPQISLEMKDLAARARAKKLKPSEFDGGTITISNLGAYGIESFDAIINPPQAAILAVGAIVDKPVVSNGQIVPGKQMCLSLSCDHRVVDGAEGAKFLAELRNIIENPALILV